MHNLKVVRGYKNGSNYHLYSRKYEHDFYVRKSQISKFWMKIKSKNKRAFICRIYSEKEKEAVKVNDMIG
jgi:hypothetical protein